MTIPPVLEIGIIMHLSFSEVNTFFLFLRFASRSAVFLISFGYSAGISCLPAVFFSLSRSIVIEAERLFIRYYRIIYK